MITVRVKLVDGNIEVFTTDKYMVSSVKDMHSAILDARVYAGSKCIVHRKRHLQWLYKKFQYKPEQEELKPEGEEKTKPEKK